MIQLYLVVLFPLGISRARRVQLSVEESRQAFPFALRDHFRESNREMNNVELGKANTEATIGSVVLLPESMQSLRRVEARAEQARLSFSHGQAKLNQPWGALQVLLLSLFSGSLSHPYVSSPRLLRTRDPRTNAPIGTVASNPDGLADETNLGNHDELFRSRLSRSAVLHFGAASIAATAVTRPTYGIPPIAYEQQTNEKVLFRPPPVKSSSTPEQIALAEHLQKTGAKFYGAYWCSFCMKQRSMFGVVGTRALPYVECAEDGVNTQSRLCGSKSEVTGYPTWEIGGKFYGGMQTLSRLQALSGFDPSVKFPEYVPPKPPPPPPGGYKPPPIKEKSTVESLALAKHLKTSGAQFYGTYWCKYCGLQRTFFGAEGAQSLPYVECAADGFQSEVSKCANAKIGSYPTWKIQDKFYSGVRSLDELATLSGFTSSSSLAAGTTANGEDCADCKVRID